MEGKGARASDGASASALEGYLPREQQAGTNRVRRRLRLLCEVPVLALFRRFTSPSTWLAMKREVEVGSKVEVEVERRRSKPSRLGKPGRKILCERERRTPRPVLFVLVRDVNIDQQTTRCRRWLPARGEGGIATAAEATGRGEKRRRG